ncbi:acyl-CoA thioesterase [Elizabethkingia anophelis]|uniref:Acyl-CoA thioesterase n=1 Tax=Elizabethkingia anophelis R26 TaxID=1246994 RepID=A0ABN5BPC9_9FLAO|nr:acyl-CoA thioesterase [Elizabethkingia anophelis]ATC34941.1 acyl-CoA thioesterase [Elizabethkingia anophelis R26]ATC38583.1 acyl-CoA thioesterase [Elizabethkingia anophelis Ag1]ATC42263.1 acyl-CoA thioesterase [Elizabethkingia anophelis]ATC45939.1 acyl-CoA thioesterase [Elizabethkingia anophelis]ELR78409.1 cytosolic long-chain acyl-CoA thioester hydrolase family protein [Elizabethkingia anophelis R26]
MHNTPTTFQFISEPTDVNFGGKVHGGSVMKWIDQVGYACASNWCGSYAVTVYVGGIRFLKPIKIGELIKINAKVIYTGSSSMHIMIDVFSKAVTSKKYEKKTHCIIVFVAVDENGNKIKVPQWKPETEHELQLEDYAKKLMALRTGIKDEMKAFL